MNMIFNLWHGIHPPFLRIVYHENNFYYSFSVDKLLAVKALLINNSKIKENPVRKNNLRMFSGSRPLVLAGDTALTVATPQERDLNTMTKLLSTTKVKKVYLAVLYPKKTDYIQDLKSFLALTKAQGVEIHIVTQPYNALDLLRSHLSNNINSTYKSHTNNDVKQNTKGG